MSETHCRSFGGDDPPSATLRSSNKLRRNFLHSARTCCAWVMSVPFSFPFHGRIFTASWGFVYARAGLAVPMCKCCVFSEQNLIHILLLRAPRGKRGRLYGGMESRDDLRVPFLSADRALNKRPMKTQSHQEKPTWTLEYTFVPPVWFQPHPRLLQF